jgi:hypothetical protein
MRIFTTGRSQLSDDPLIYLLMEYDDESLSEVIPTRPLTAEEVREMLKHALSALAYVHGHGFLHGHLKPAKHPGRGWPTGNLERQPLPNRGHEWFENARCLHSTRDRGYLACPATFGRWA